MFYFKLHSPIQLVCFVLGSWATSGAHGQIIFSCPTTAGFLMWSTLSDERTGV
jgi:hypothetical protein